MRVAYFAESPADQAALTIFTEAILGHATTPISHSGLVHRGWPSVRTVLPAVLKELHYHSDAEGFVLVVDSNGSTPHEPTHDLVNARESKCRLCQLRLMATETLRQVRPRSSQPALKIALGLAVPAIEAWLLCGVNTQVSEATWINGRNQNQSPYSTSGLKEQLYGTSHPSLAMAAETMKREAARVSQKLSTIEKVFPQGFGSLAADIRSW